MMTLGRQTLGLVSLALACMSCGSDPTGVLVILDADMAVRGLARTVDFRVYATDSAMPPGEVPALEVDQEALDVQPGNWPYEIFLRPGATGTEGRYRLVATVSEGGEVFRAQVISGYVRGEIRYAYLRLDRPCADVNCPPDDTCAAGTCRSALVDPAMLCTSADACIRPSEDCMNGMDDDGDGLSDCMDPDCASAPGCGPACAACTDPSMCRMGAECNGTCCVEADCDDGIDNDDDGRRDCADPDCAGSPICPSDCGGACGGVDCAFQICGDGGGICSPDGTICEENDCFDGFDNDMDGLFDCDDADCQRMPDVCDDPCDGQPDGSPCGDGAAECWGAECIEVDCTDGIDNDGDDLFDCDDDECDGNVDSCGAIGACNFCESHPSCNFQPCMGDTGFCDGDVCVREIEVCDNGADDDFDGAVDCMDSDCFGLECGFGEGTCFVGDCTVEFQTCTGADDDGDGRLGCSDPDCSVELSCDAETNCMDTLDDDGDGLTDCDDPDCFYEECGGGAVCFNYACVFEGDCAGCLATCATFDPLCWGF